MIILNWTDCQKSNSMYLLLKDMHCVDLLVKINSIQHAKSQFIRNVQFYYHDSWQEYANLTAGCLVFL